MSASIDISQAIAVAEQALGGQARPSELRIVSAKLHSTPENDVTGRNPSAGSELVKKLRGVTYWLIYYRSTGSELGGEVGVFIDVTSGKVIYVYRGR